MTLLKHGEYQGEVFYEDGVLVIRLLHVDDIITASTDSAAGAQKAFEELVEDYLETCKELGKEPCKPFKGSFNVRVTPALHKQIALAAADCGETLNAYVTKAIQDRLEPPVKSDNIADLVSELVRVRMERAQVQRGFYQMHPSADDRRSAWSGWSHADYEEWSVESRNDWIIAGFQSLPDLPITAALSRIADRRRD